MVCQASLYPLDAEYSAIILDAVRVLEEHSVVYQVGCTSTVVAGRPEAVWDAIRSLYETAEKSGKPLVMVATFTNACSLEKPPTCEPK